MESIWTLGQLNENHWLPWIPFVCLMGCLISFWWLRYHIKVVPHSISATAYINKTLFIEFCLINSISLGLLYAWESANFANDWGMFAMLFSALLLPWLARFWNYKGWHKIPHFSLAIIIFGCLSYWVGRWWYLPLIVGALSGLISNKKYKIFWAEFALYHVIIGLVLYGYYLV